MSLDTGVFVGHKTRKRERHHKGDRISNTCNRKAEAGASLRVEREPTGKGHGTQRLAVEEGNARRHSITVDAGRCYYKYI